ncbi:MAG: acyclic terpene utilization AtuA family protein [Candidatus Sumerlaeia bacterium]|nr:acyclic terpene utilization AtuA family protein [Candidatus Sumerlaeia bacterium]
MIRIGSAQGFWGDWPQAPGLQLRGGPLDFLIFDYLAEVTMSILEKQRRRDPALGYATDFVATMRELLPELLDRKVRVVSSAGGVNPRACAEAVLAAAREVAPGRPLKVAVVRGDSILDRIGDFKLKALDPSAPRLDEVRDRLLSANVYFGAEPVAEALRMGADIVITGRVTDTALVLGPLLASFDVSRDDHDALALGVVAGHILECGAQSSGGNFLGRFLEVEEMVKIGFPIAEFADPHTLAITKHPGLGGCVTRQTVSEQLLYEIGDPKEYLTPDVSVDFTSIRLEETGPDRVRVHGVQGGPPPPMLKVSCAYADGYALSGTLVYTWPEAVKKARTAGELIRRRGETLGLRFDDFRVETIGFYACHEGMVGPPAESSEVMLRVAVRSQSREDLDRLGRELVPLVLTGPPGATGFAGGRPRAHEVLAYWPGLIARDAVAPVVELLTSDTKSEA